MVTINTLLASTGSGLDQSTTTGRWIPTSYVCRGCLNGSSGIIFPGSHRAGRDQFTFNRLLPPAMAAAVELVQEDLPSDPLSACLTFLVGLSGLLRIGTRTSSSLRHHVPVNLFFAVVAWSGVAKSPQKRKLVERPAAGLIQEAREQHDRAMRQWRQQNKDIKRKEDRPPEPKCVLPHLTDYNAALPASS